MLHNVSLFFQKYFKVMCKFTEIMSIKENKYFFSFQLIIPNEENHSQFYVGVLYN